MRQILQIIFLFLIFSCSENKNKDSRFKEIAYSDQQNPIDTMIIKRSIFREELVNNWKLNALRKSDLQFRVGELLGTLILRNGDAINADKIITDLNSFPIDDYLLSYNLN